MAEQAYLAHILAQTRANIDFLVEHHQITAPDARLILDKLPNSNTTLSIDRSLANLAIEPVPLALAPRPIQAKALWNYTGQNPNDLSFNTGDLIIILKEENADWSTGRNTRTGSEGLFPANYVEKLSSRPVPRPPSATTEKSVYSATPSAYAPSDGPPPGGYQYSQPVAQYQLPPQPPIQAYNAPPPPQQQEQRTGGGLGSSMKNTLAHSAVGGVGFGAGSAVGSGIINSIF